MTTQTHQQNWWHRLNVRIAATPAGAWFYARTLHHFDRSVKRLSGGQSSLTSLFSGVEPVWLTTTGVKSGLSRTVPLLGIEDGEKIFIIASNWGQNHHPAWYLNLRADPEVTLSVRGRTAAYVAREAKEEEREDCWQKAIAYYPGYAAYRQRVRERQIPIIMLTPKNQ